MVINDLIENWTNEKWQKIEVHQRERLGEYKKDFITAGTTGKSDTAKFEFIQDTSTNVLLQRNSPLEGLAKTMAVTVFLPFYLGLGVFGNTGVVQAAVSLRQNGLKDLRSQLPTANRVWSHIVPIFKGLLAYKAIQLVRESDFQLIAGYNFFTTFAITAWATYMLYNPYGAAAKLNFVEELVGAEQLPECQAAVHKNFTFAKNWREFIEGRIPLTYMVGIKSPGNISDKVEGKKVFEVVQS